MSMNLPVVVRRKTASRTAHNFSVLRWLQVGAGAAGMGFGLIAATGVAAADDGGIGHSSGASGSAHSVADAAKPARPRITNRAAHDRKPLARTASADSVVTLAAARSPQAISGHQASPAAAKHPVAETPEAETGAESDYSPIDFTRYTTGPLIMTPREFINAAAINFAGLIDDVGRYVSGLPSNSLTETVSAGLWMLRRAVVPVGSAVGVWGSAACINGSDCSGQDLAGVDLRGQDLSGMNFARAVLYQAALAGADLSGVDFSNADLPDADLSGADLTNAILHGALLAGANLRNAIIDGTDFTDEIGPPVGTGIFTPSDLPWREVSKELPDGAPVQGSTKLIIRNELGPVGLVDPNYDLNEDKIELYAWMYGASPASLPGDQNDPNSNLPTPRGLGTRVLVATLLPGQSWTNTDSNFAAAIPLTDIKAIPRVDHSIEVVNAQGVTVMRITAHTAPLNPGPIVTSYFNVMGDTAIKKNFPDYTWLWYQGDQRVVDSWEPQGPKYWVWRGPDFKSNSAWYANLPPRCEGPGGCCLPLAPSNQ